MWKKVPSGTSNNNTPWTRSKVLSHTQFQTSILQQMDSQTRLLFASSITLRIFWLGITAHVSSSSWNAPAHPFNPPAHVYYSFRAYLKLLLFFCLCLLNVLSFSQWPQYTLCISYEDNTTPELMLYTAVSLRHPGLSTLSPVQYLAQRKWAVNI
jgi:hypothetical protein